jgi:hypothetical protein
MRRSRGPMPCTSGESISVATLVAISYLACGGRSTSVPEDGSVDDRTSAIDARVDEASADEDSHNTTADACPPTPIRTGSCSLPSGAICSYGFLEPSSSPTSCGGVQTVCRGGQWSEDLHSDPGRCCATLGPDLLTMNGCLDAGPDGPASAVTDASASPPRTCDASSAAPFSTDAAGLEAGVACFALSGTACVSCCADKNRTGQAELDLVGSGCMCATCSASCTAMTCDMHGLPQTPCIACVKQSLASDCACDGYLDRFCGDLECRSYLNCIINCPD